MATTSLWHIKGKLRDLIDYIENPDKTKLLFFLHTKSLTGIVKQSISNLKNMFSKVHLQLSKRLQA